MGKEITSKMLPDNVKVFFRGGKEIACWANGAGGRVTKKGKKITGQVAQYDAKGALICVEKYVNNVRQGSEFVYYPSGEVMKSKHYKNGREHGKFIWFSENGVVEKTEIYSSGKLIKTVIHETSAEKIPSGPETSHDSENYSSIDGWLILVGIGLVIGIFIILKEFDLSAAFLSYKNYVACVFLLLMIYMNILFFNRSKRFPATYIILQLSLLILIGLTAMLVNPDGTDKTVTPFDAFKQLLVCSIWVPYFIYSKRVKATFTVTPLKTDWAKRVVIIAGTLLTVVNLIYWVAKHKTG